MSSSDKIIVGYWNIRFLVAPIQYLLKLSGLEHEVKIYEFNMDGKSNDEIAVEWINDKPKLGLAFPNLPYLIHGDVKITESLAVIRYIARKAGLYGVAADATPEQHAQLDNVEQRVNDLRWNYFNYCMECPEIPARFPEGFPASTVRQLATLAKWLENRLFVMGDKICYVDLILFEVIEVFKMINPDCLATYPGLVAYDQRIRSIPAIKEHLESSDFIEWPVVGPVAGQKFGWKK